MVWFQCEDCGDNLKKPKLPGHFRICSASKLSCIDCGEVFGQQTVEAHTQCITEAEKYGPKGQGKTQNGSNAKPNSNAKQKPEIDINVGLSGRPPWFCSLCNTKTTSKQTLLLHADGKKHRAKARAFQAAKQLPDQSDGSTPTAEDATKNNVPNDLSLDTSSEEPKEKNLSSGIVSNNSEVKNGTSQISKKRKHRESENGLAIEKIANDASVGVETLQVKKVKESDTKEDKTGNNSSCQENGLGKIKWKKLIKMALKSNPDGRLKLKKLGKLVLKYLKESGFTDNESQVNDKLLQKINSSPRFTVDGKYVRLASES